MAKQRRACDGCHKRKIQCDLSESGPKCNWCTHRGLPCTFVRVKSTANLKPKKKVDRDTITRRIGRIENFIAHAETYSEGHSTASPPERSESGSSEQHEGFKDFEEHHPFPTISSEFRPRSDRGRVPGRSACGQIYFAGCYLGTVDSPDRLPAFSDEGLEWIFSATGERPRFWRPTASDAATLDQSYITHMPLDLPCGEYPDGREQFPELWVTQNLFDEFKESSTRHVFPVVDEVLFEGTIAIAYGPRPETNPLEYYASRACVLAFVSLMSFQFSYAPAACVVNRWECTVCAQSLIARCLNFPSLTTLQTIIILKLNCMALGQLRAGVMFHAMACRTLCNLGAHTIVPTSGHPMTHIERVEAQQRTLFWLCYIFDKNFALRTGRPPNLSDEYCDLTMPPEYLEGRFGGPEITGRIDGTTYPVFFGDIRLSILKSKVCRELYSVQSLRKSNAEILQSIRELDEELESWRSSLPMDFKPRVSLSPNYQKWMSDVDYARSVRHIELHLEYHHLVAAIHCASGRCFNNGRIDPRIIGLQSSLDLSVEASRTTIIYLGVAIDSLPGEAYWGFLFYPMSALMTLFFNVLRDPLAAEAESDIQLISSAGDLIRRMPSHYTLRVHESFFDQLGGFIAELSRLGGIALARALSAHLG